MSEIRFYKGKYQVKVLTKTRGKWIVEALEEFHDYANNKNFEVKSGMQRSISPNLLFKRKNLPPPLKEHVYELKMEKRLKHLVAQEAGNKK